MAYKQLFPTGKKGSFFTWMAIIGVALGVMVLLIVQCVMEGFGEAIKSRLTETQGDIRVESGAPFTYDKSMIDKITHLKAVDSAAPYAHGMMMARFANRSALTYVKGIDFCLEEKVVPIQKYLLESSKNTRSDDGVWLSAQLASHLGVAIGDSIDLFSPLILDRLHENEILLPEEVEVQGIFSTGWHQIDSKTILVSLETMQRLYAMPGSIHGISIRLKKFSDEKSGLQELSHTLPFPLKAFPVLAMSEDLLFVLKLEKTVLFFIILFVILVASFSIASSLMTAAIRKTREIGLLRALGATHKEIALSFFFQGFFIGVTGTSLGLILGFLVLFFRNPIVQVFANLTHSEAILIQFYQFTEIPVAYKWGDLLAIAPTAIAIATLASLFPAWKASRLLPANALRFDH